MYLVLLSVMFHNFTISEVGTNYVDGFLSKSSIKSEFNKLSTFYYFVLALFA